MTKANVEQTFLSFARLFLEVLVLNQSIMNLLVTIMYLKYCSFCSFCNYNRLLVLLFSFTFSTVSMLFEY